MFHATELFNGGGPVFKRLKRDEYGPEEWSKERRWNLGDQLALIPKKFGLHIVLGWVDRREFPQTFELPADMPLHDKTVAAHVFAFMNCAMGVEHWLRGHHNEICLLVIEDNDNARKMIRDTQRHYQDRKIAPTLDEKAKLHFPFRRIKQDPLFEEKRPLSVLQVADFIAYVWKRKLMDDERYERFVWPWWPRVVVRDPSTLSKRPGRMNRRTHPPQLAGQSR